MESAETKAAQALRRLLRQSLFYDPATGDVRWSRSLTGHRKGGAVAYRVNRLGYKQIRIGSSMLQAHRVAWFLYYGRFPSGELDHIDGDKANNRIENLRVATRSQNTANRGKTKRNTSGFKGVCWHKRDKRWRAVVGVKGRRIDIGAFDTPEEAFDAYKAAAVRYHGEFAKW